jgi:hypoxanthine phosphoribosyltransferase
MIKNSFTSDDILKATHKLVREIADKDYDCVIGVNRGGVVFSTYVSYESGIPGAVINFQYKNSSIESVDLKVDYKQYFNISEIASSVDIGKCKNILIIDDDCDSGFMINSIIKYLRERYANLEKIDTAVLACYEDSTYKPTYFYKSLKEGYSCYPWNLNNF